MGHGIFVARWEVAFATNVEDSDFRKKCDFGQSNYSTCSSKQYCQAKNIFQQFKAKFYILLTQLFGLNEVSFSFFFFFKDMKCSACFFEVIMRLQTNFGFLAYVFFFDTFAIFVKIFLVPKI